MKFASAIAAGFYLALACACLQGCGTDQSASNTPPSKPIEQPSTQPTSGMIGSPSPDQSSASGEPAPPQNETTKQQLADLAKESKAAAAAKEQMDKKPADAQSKQQFVKTNDKLAYDTMMCDGLTPHEKYSGALKIYRESLKVDPNDADANKWVNMIISIYKSMHRPVPTS